MEVCDYLNIPTAPEGEGWNQGRNTPEITKKKKKNPTKNIIKYQLYNKCI